MTTKARRRSGLPEVEIELALECRDPSIASALNETLMPDNRYFPKDQKFSTSIEGSTIRCKIRSPRARPAVGTVASMISDAKLFSELWLEASTLGRASAAK